MRSVPVWWPVSDWYAASTSSRLARRAHARPGRSPPQPRSRAMNRTRFLLSIAFLAAATLAVGGIALAAKPQGKPEHQQQAHGNKDHQKKGHHQNGKQMLGEKIKTNGRHAIDQKGEVSAEVEVKNGKIAGMHAKHAKKG